MQRPVIAWIASVFVLAACTLSLPFDHDDTGVETVTAPVVSPPPSKEISLLRADTTPYENVTHLLDDVCYAFLELQGTKTIVWENGSEMASFFQRVNDSELCGATATPSFDFSTQIVVGAVSQATGCDAAHRVESLADNPESATLILTLSLQVRTGCDYELIEPVLIALPLPPDRSATRVEIHLQ